MNCYIFLDTETTGVEPGSRVLEIAALATDENGNEIGRVNRLIKPGMKIPPDVLQVNGITQEDIDRDGVDMIDTLKELHELYLSVCDLEPPVCDLETQIVIHNAPYDCGVISWGSVNNFV
ncbi:3'-5' exonuclease [Chrysiogenes arsenatis]|uniref:3'-5' exonuclease n=1 Tax=Chrysiogenes arsenatis TaxID=309797 RepID=UPI0022A954A7|nr:3'-5' exonuclease [Chrysiogenes arsenatis]